MHAYRTLTMVCYEVLARAIHLDVMKTRTHVSSEASQTCDDFRTRLLERDCCVWTGVPEHFEDGFHIIPHMRLGVSKYVP